MGNEIVCSSVLLDVYVDLNITLIFNANSLKITIVGTSFKPIFEFLRRTAFECQISCTINKALMCGYSSCEY